MPATHIEVSKIDWTVTDLSVGLSGGRKAERLCHLDLGRSSQSDQPNVDQRGLIPH
ncbi:hypothetical protein P3T16_006169 [Paraburkholderia sp. GAS42]|jgi:hypothetical protein